MTSPPTNETIVQPGPGPSAERLAGAFVVLLGLTIIVWLTLQPFPPLQDFPEWIYQAYLLDRIVGGDPAAARLFTIAPYPVPNSLSQIAMGLMMFVRVPPMVAAEVWLLLYVVSFVSVAWVGLKRLQPGRSAGSLVVLSVAVIFGSSFWDGYINFQYGLLLLGAYCLLREAFQRRSAWLICLFGILIFCSHAAVFLAFVLYVVAREVLQRPRNYRAAVGLLPSLVLIVWYTLAKGGSHTSPIPGGGVYHSVAGFVEYKIYTAMKLGPFHNFVNSHGLSQRDLLPALYWAGIGLNAVFAATLLLAAVQGLVKMMARGGATPRPHDDRTPAILVLPVTALLVAFVVAPDLIDDVVNIGERFLLAALVIIIVAVPLHRALLTAAAAVGLLALPLTVCFVATAHEGSSVAVPSDETRGLFVQRSYQFAEKAAFLGSPRRVDYPALSFTTSIILPAGSRQ